MITIADEAEPDRLTRAIDRLAADLGIPPAEMSARIMAGLKQPGSYGQ